MSISTIPNQPINFTKPLIIAACPEKEPPVLMAPGDPIVFQFLQERCEGADQYLESIGPSEWIDNPGWTIGAGFAALTVGNGGQYIEESSWTAVVGMVYDVEVVVGDIAGDGFFIQVGGTQTAVFTPGTHRFTVEAAIATGARATAIGDNSAGTITSFKVYEANRNFSVAVVDESGEVVSYSPTGDPEMFVYNGQHVTFSKYFDEEVSGCFTFQLADNCTEEPVTYCSQTFQPVGCEQGIVLRTCNDANAMGFVPGYFQARVSASLVRPNWEFEVSEERLSNGVLNRHFIERQEVYQLSVETVGASLHPWLAAAAMFDHFYVEGTEWSVDADGYQPGYGDRTGNGGVLLTVRNPKKVLRRVRCADIWEGCDPANDPICNTANADVQLVLQDGDILVRIDVYGSMGFVIKEAIYTVNGVPQPVILINGTPGTYGGGDINPGDVVTVTLVNANDPLCNDVRGPFSLNPTLCDLAASMEGCESFTFTITEDPDDPGEAFLIRSNQEGQGGTEWFTVVEPDGNVVPIENVSGGDGYTAVSGLVKVGNYCVYASDENGNPAPGVFYDLLFGWSTGFYSPTSDLDLSRLTSIGAEPSTNELIVAGVVFNTKPAIQQMLNMTNIVLQGCKYGPGAFPEVTGLSALLGASFTNSNLPSSEVDRIFNEISATTTAGGGAASTIGQTPPAPPTSASDAARTELSSRSPAWLLGFD
jgi:hypothetical protein